MLARLHLALPRQPDVPGAAVATTQTASRLVAPMAVEGWPLEPGRRRPRPSVNEPTRGPVEVD